MNTVGSATSVTASVGANRTSVQIALPSPNQLQTNDANLEAAIHRVATTLYMRAHCEVPPDVTDMGGGIFNVVV